MALYPSGQPIRLSTTVRDVTGTLVNAGTLTLLVKVTAADGTQTTTGTYASPANDGPGLYHQDIPVTDLTVIGHYQYTWTATGTGAGVSFGEFDVFDPFGVSVIMSLQEAKDHLNFRAGTDSDDELYRFMRAATELIETRVGICGRRTFINYVDDPDGTFGLLVPHHPVLSVQSVTSLQLNGPSWVAANLRADDAGIIWQTIQAPFWGSPWNVAYTCGRTQVPERFVHAAKEQLRHLWDTQRGSMPPPLLSGEELFTTAAGFSFSVPRRVLELIQDEIMPAI